MSTSPLIQSLTKMPFSKDVAELGVYDWTKEGAQVDYETMWSWMRELTDTRMQDTLDQIWLVEHPPVFTLGQAGLMEHLIANTNIPVIKTDRGGQITYHGPGQIVIYFMCDLKRRKQGIRDLVCQIEQSIINLLAEFGVEALRKSGAPGVYVSGQKIASLGLRVRKGCTYHGLALNLDMDLSPFSLINPCGYEGLKMTQLKDLVAEMPLFSALKKQFIAQIVSCLGYHTPKLLTETVSGA